MTQNKLENLQDYKGVCHVHSDISDGHGTVEDIIDAAKKTGIDFVILTDHNAVIPTELEKDGWQNDVLIIIGCEISSRRRGGHVIILNDKGQHAGHKQYHKKYAGELLDKANDNSKPTFIAHPMGLKKIKFMIYLAAWSEWSHKGFTGLELWSYMHDWMEDLGIINFFKFYRNPNVMLKGPNPKLLAIWDELNRSRKVVGISGLDAHARKIPLTGLQIFPYEDLFKTIRTHILTPPFTGDSKKDIRLVNEAHKNGKCYIAFDWLSDATGFQFFITANDKIYRMGDEMMLKNNKESKKDDLFIQITSPQNANLRVIRNGKLLIEKEGNCLEFSNNDTGVYRVEAYINNKPWVFTNPIFVR